MRCPVGILLKIFFGGCQMKQNVPVKRPRRFLANLCPFVFPLDRHIIFRIHFANISTYIPSCQFGNSQLHLHTSKSLSYILSVLSSALQSCFAWEDLPHYESETPKEEEEEQEEALTRMMVTVLEAITMPIPPVATEPARQRYTHRHLPRLLVLLPHP